LKFRISYRPGDFSKTAVPYKFHRHAFTGLARALGSGEDLRSYGTYEIALYHVRDVFLPEDAKHWNEAYESAKKIFGSPMVRSTVITQHNHLYSQVSITRFGLLHGGQDLLKLLKNGILGGKPRFFTYAIRDDIWYFSETGASFFTDFTSKHAMHACASETVWFAGEFVIVKKNDNGEYKLVIDNNSGTYAPVEKNLPKLKTLLTLNFPGLEVETLDYHSPQLKLYKEYVLNFK
jgi:hypothetical protein